MEYRHLIFIMRIAYESGAIEHPQKVMRSLGITYQHATPQTIGDCWQFFNCENIPDPLPEYLREFNDEPVKWINNGLSEEVARKLTKG